MCVQHPHVFRRPNNNFKLWGRIGVMGIQQLLGFIGALWNHKNETDEAVKKKVMPLETAMFLEIYTQMKSRLKEEQQAPVVVKIPVSGQCGSMFIWDGVVSAWVGGWEEVTKNFNHSGSLRIMSRVCEGMCARESFLRFFAASTIAAWQRLRIGREVRGFAGNTSVQKCQTQICRNAKHKCIEMPNTIMKKCKTSLVCRNGLCWWVVSSEFCFNQYMISMLTGILVVSCIWFSALCVFDCVYQSGGLQQCRDYPRVDITISVSVYYCITITVSKGGYYNHSNWHHDDSALSRGPQTLAFCKARGTIARSIILQISPSWPLIYVSEKAIPTIKHHFCRPTTRTTKTTSNSLCSSILTNDPIILYNEHNTSTHSENGHLRENGDHTYVSLQPEIFDCDLVSF